MFHDAFWGLTQLAIGKLPADLRRRVKLLVPVQAWSVRVWAESSESEDQKPGLFSGHRLSLLDCCSAASGGGGGACVGVGGWGVGNAPMQA